MPSFLDELRSKQETVIKAETAANNEVEKLMQIKPAVIDRVMQIEAKRTVGRIKNDIAKEIEKNPSAKCYVVRYRGQSFVDHLHIFDLIKVFSEFGYNFDSKSLYSALREMGLSGVVYDDDNKTYSTRWSIVELYYETNDFWHGRRNVVNKEGKRFIKLLSDAAAAEGIKITYRDIFKNYDKSHFMGLSKAKESKKEEYLDECSFVTASVRL